MQNLMISYPFVLFISLLQIVHGAYNFYGADFIFLPYSTVKSEWRPEQFQDINLQFHFRTFKTDASLFSLGNENDYLSAVIEYGYLRISLKLLNLDPIVIKSSIILGKLANGESHDVQVKRTNFSIVMTVDQVDSHEYLDKNAAQRQFRLIGPVLLGGSKIDHDLPIFRGCIEVLKLGSMDVLRLINPTYVSDSVRLTTKCRPDFRAENLPSTILSFYGNRSYVQIESKSLEATETFSLSFSFMTQSYNGMLIFFPGESAVDEFFMIGIKDLYLQCIITRPDRSWYERSQDKISIGKWYSLEVEYHSDHVELRLDGKAFPELIDHSRFGVPFQQNVFLGSIQSFGSFANRVRKLLGIGDFNGCMEDVKINGQIFNNHEVSTTFRVGSKCPYLEKYVKNTTLLKKDCEHYPWYFENTQTACKPDLDEYMSDDVSRAVHVRNRDLTFIDTQPDPSEYSVISVNSLIVQEGTEVPIQHTRNLMPIGAYMSIQSNNIIFTVTGGLRHGRLLVGDSYSRTEVNHFSFFEMENARVFYGHDGSDVTEDQIDFDVSFNTDPDDFSNSQEQKDLFQRIVAITLPIKIRPVDDRPRIEIKPGHEVIVMIEHSSYPISLDLFDIFDSDTEYKDMDLKVKFSMRGRFYLFRKQKPRQPITIFNADDLLTDTLRIQHSGHSTDQMTITVSDQTSESDPITFTIRTRPLKFMERQNTGVEVLHAHDVTISSKNLTYITDAPTIQAKEQDLQYVIDQSPLHGYLQLRELNQWYVAGIFNESQLQQNLLRYAHTSMSKPDSDKFTFRLQAFGYTSRVEYTFKIKFKRMMITTFHKKTFKMVNDTKMVINKVHLQSHTYPKNTLPIEIVYIIERPPSKGYLYKMTRPGPLKEIDRQRNRNRRMGQHSNFTQKDIEDKKIFYELSQQGVPSAVMDSFTFTVITPSVSSERVSQFSIVYVIDTPYKLTNRSFVVDEGASVTISREMLWFQSGGCMDYKWTILELPEHGSLRQESLLLYNRSDFVSAEIMLGKIQYQHDDSESTSDQMLFLVHPRCPELRDSGFELAVKLALRIVRINDNEPKPVIMDESGRLILKIQKNIKRFVRPQDLRFVDDDDDSGPKDIFYHFVETDLGVFYRVHPTTKINVFSQFDIDTEQVMYEDKSDHSTSWMNAYYLPFNVTDGKYIVPHKLRVEAGKPFLDELLNLGLTAKYTGVTLIPSERLTYRTNINVSQADIMYTLKTLPTYGDIVVVEWIAGQEVIPANLDPVTTFSQDQINKGQIGYRSNRIRAGANDRFTFEATIRPDRNVTGKIGMFRIKVMETNAELFQIEPIPKLQVINGGFALITSETLSASHPSYTPSSTMWNIVDAPTSGEIIKTYTYIRSDGENANMKQLYDDNMGSKTRFFSQFDVDVNHVYYHHYGIDKNDNYFDNVKFNVTVGEHQKQEILTIEVLSDEIEIILHKNVSVKRGKTVVIDQSILSVDSQFHGQTPFMIDILEYPGYGWLENNNQRIESGYFTSKEMQMGQISYLHDATAKSWKDKFMIKGRIEGYNQKKTKEIIVYVDIEQPNRQGPTINKGQMKPLETWGASRTKVTTEHLFATDVDTSDSRLTYRFGTVSLGHFTCSCSPGVKVFEFTQENVNNGEVSFLLDEKKSKHQDHSATLEYTVNDNKFYVKGGKLEILVSRMRSRFKNYKTMYIGPDGQKPISKIRLSTVIDDADVEPSRIEYEVVDHPDMGNLVVGTVKNADSFTQEDINRDNVLFDQQGTLERWSYNDRFTFNIYVNRTQDNKNFRQKVTDKLEKYHIVITYGQLSPTKFEAYVICQDIKLSRGETVVISREHIDVRWLVAKIKKEDLRIFIEQLPQQGYLEFDNHNVTLAGFVIDPADLRRDSGKLFKYHHTKINSPTSDRLYLYVAPENHDPHNDIYKMRIDISVEIIEKGYDFPSTDMGVVNVVFPYTHTLTKELLCKNNVSSVPCGSHINYIIKDRPLNGDFYRMNKQVTEFSYQQILKREVKFRSTNFQYERQRVTILAINSLSNSSSLKLGMTFVVKELKLNLKNHSAVYFKQLDGKMPTVLNISHVSIETNGKLDDVVYWITKHPKHGVLFRQSELGKQVGQFTQYDVNTGTVRYQSTNAESYLDTLDFNILHTKLTNQKFSIGKTLKFICLSDIDQTVIPTLDKSDKEIILRSSILNAQRIFDALGEDTQLIIKILTGPSSGKLWKKSRVQPDPKMKVRRKRDGFEVMNQSLKQESADQQTEGPSRQDQWEPNVIVFTYQEVANEMIKYTLNDSMTKDTEEVIEYELEIANKGYPRGMGKLTIQLSMGKSGESNLITTTVHSLVEELNSLPLMKADHTIPISVAVALCVLAGFLIVVCKVRVSMLRHKKLARQKPNFQEPAYEKTSTLSKSKLGTFSCNPHNGSSNRNNGSKSDILKQSLIDSQGSASATDDSSGNPKVILRKGRSSSASDRFLNKGSSKNSLNRDHNQNTQKTSPSTNPRRASSLYATSPIARKRYTGTEYINNTMTQSVHSDAVNKIHTHPPPPRLVTFDSSASVKPDALSSIPMCRVTPIATKTHPHQQPHPMNTASSTCSSSSDGEYRSPYHAFSYSSSGASDQDTTSSGKLLNPISAEQRIAERRRKMSQMQRSNPNSSSTPLSGSNSTIKQMKLQDNQYWV